MDISHLAPKLLTVVLNCLQQHPQLPTWLPHFGPVMISAMEWAPLVMKYMVQAPQKLILTRSALISASNSRLSSTVHGCFWRNGMMFLSMVDL